jgi:ribosomal protein L3
MLGPNHFNIGQFVDVTSTSKGKGYQGVMKRWNFSGQKASHGNSKAHRLPGSIGQCEYPGKVWKGKKMAGQLGYQSATILSQRVVRIDEPRSLLYVMGNVPGAIGNLVKIRDAVKKTERQWWDLQYPTRVPSDKVEEAILTWDGGEIDPNEIYIHENDVVSGTKDDGD